METRILKFRVSFRISEPRRGRLSSEEKTYPSFAKARRNYKSILLQMYRNKELQKWEVCLNRTRHDEWQSPIFYESGQGFQYTVRDVELAHTEDIL